MINIFRIIAAARGGIFYSRSDGSNDSNNLVHCCALRVQHYNDWKIFTVKFVICHMYSTAAYTGASVHVFLWPLVVCSARQKARISATSGCIRTTCARYADCTKQFIIMLLVYLNLGGKWKMNSTNWLKKIINRGYEIFWLFYWVG